MFEAYLVTYPEIGDPSDDDRFNEPLLKFFDYTSNLSKFTLLSANLSLQAGYSGSFSFTVSRENVSYGLWNNLSSYVEIKNGLRSVFYGRVYSIKTDMYMNYQIECEGALSFLNDYYVRPQVATYSSLFDLLSALMAQYNESMSRDKRISLSQQDIEISYTGEIPFETGGGTLYSVLDELVNAYGGYLKIIRKESVIDSKHYDLALGWINANNATRSSQFISFGENLLSIDQEALSDDIITVIIPYGATIENTNSRVDITTVNDGKDWISVIVDSSPISEMYGRVEQSIIFEDITDPSALKSAAETYAQTIINSIAPVSINVKAVDLSFADLEQAVDSFVVGEKVRVYSPIYHGINEDFLIDTLNIDLLNPESNTLEIGRKRQGYIGMTDKVISYGYSGAPFRKVELLENVAFVDGKINKNTGAKETSTTFSCSNSFIEVEYGNVLYVDVAEGYKCYVSGFTGTSSISSPSINIDYKSGWHTIPEPYPYYKITYSTDPESSSPAPTTNPSALSVYQYRR